MTILPQLPENEVPDEPEGAPVLPTAAPARRPGGGLRVVPPLPEASDPEGPEPARERPARRRPGVTTILPAAGVASLVGLLAWAAFVNTGASSPRGWEAVPAGQPQAVIPATPKVPHTASATNGVVPPIVSTAARAAVTLKVDSGPAGGTYGSDGQVHDAFSPAIFSVPAGREVTVRVENYDDMGHSLTAPALGLDVWIPGGGSTPSVTTFHFRAPSSTGNYLWVCGVPCDPWSMATPGYMQGEIRVVA